jgi:penicillin-binding protein 2
VLANGGLLVKPHLVSGLIDENGKLLRDLTPPPDGRIGLQPDYLQYLVDGMKAVTEWGTSSNAFVGLPFKVAGKTGTAEVQGASACAGTAMCQYGVYVAFAPADKPEIAVAVVGERAGHGDSMNPVARAALAKYFHVNLPADDPLYALGILPRLAPVAAPTPSFPQR